MVFCIDPEQDEEILYNFIQQGWDIIGQKSKPE